ncbi:MAG: class I SAM-dependent methyltransferase [Desulfobacteraceae bacterium]|nr:MAG: class I SAM-dependent methyltransferase [Desulfobacteraceae bacterium]
MRRTHSTPQPQRDEAQRRHEVKLRANRTFCEAVKFDRELLENVKGFLDPEEGMRLYDTALLAAGKGPCLEIGSYCGKSAIYLGTACREKNSILFSIDHHRGSEEQQPGEEYFDPELFDFASWRMNTLGNFRITLDKAGLEENVVPIVTRSDVAARMWSSPLNLVFIDGGHSYETALMDYNCWAGHIVPGGYLLIHDIFPDPANGGQAPFLVYNHALESNLFKELPMTKTLGVLQRII